MRALPSTWVLSDFYCYLSFWTTPIIYWTCFANQQCVFGVHDVLKNGQRNMISTGSTISSNLRYVSETWLVTFLCSLNAVFRATSFFLTHEFSEIIPPPPLSMWISGWRWSRSAGFQMCSIIQQSLSIILALFPRFEHLLSLLYLWGQRPSSFSWPLILLWILFSKQAQSIGFQLRSIMQQSFSIVLASFPRFRHLLIIFREKNFGHWPQAYIYYKKMPESGEGDE